MLVFRILVSDVSVQCYFEPVVAVTSAKAFADVCCLDGIACAVLLQHTDVCNAMVETCIGGGTICEFCVCRNCRVEVESSGYIPVAVDVLGACNASSGLFDVSNFVADAVGCYVITVTATNEDGAHSDFIEIEVLNAEDMPFVWDFDCGNHTWFF